MVERIREILQARQLTPTQFADTIGVARPIVSHILSGRNKPSLEVVQKIIGAFPDLSLPWLLNGQGTMDAGSPALAQPEPASSLKRTRTASDTPAKANGTPAPLKRRESVAPEPDSGANELRAVSTPAGQTVLDLADPVAEPRPASAPVSQPILPVIPSTVVEATTRAAPAVASPASPIRPDKTIRRIVIFYHDGTFSDFQPEPGTGL
ncbi:helix-turn-helix domain-containing protein [Hymenobacter sp. BT175]|nr:helix-turn-helix domain-containing protein [Hymenobacter translucens]